MIDRIFDLLPYMKERYSKEDMLAVKDKGVWEKYSTEEYVETVDYISYGLLALGVQKDDKIASISMNRPEINFLEMGLLQIGAIHVPVYPTISENDYRFILAHCDAKYLFFYGDDIYRKIAAVIPEIPAIKEVFVIKSLHPSNLTNLTNFRNLSDLIELGKKNVNKEKLESIKATIKASDIAWIIYTSGTTGFPKGVMLMHSNILSNVFAGSYIPKGLGFKNKALSFFPMCHAYEKMMTYLYQYLGISVYYAENIGTVGDNMREIKPDIMTTVPRFIDKIYYRIISNGRKLSKTKKRIFFWAVALGLKFELNHANGILYDIKLKIADMLVFRKWRQALGGNLKLIVSGGAALQPMYSKIFWAAGFNLMEGYGMTESSPVIAVYNYDKGGMKFGTVGQVLRGVQVKIAADGEILAKGPNIMVGYYKDEKQTHEAIDSDGWLHTGDLGMLEENILLRITGRKKDMFKTSHGKYIVPQPIENKFKESLLIDNIMVIGENQKFPAAIIVPDFNDLSSWCANKLLRYTTDSEMTKLPFIRLRYQKEVDTYNLYFGEEEQIKRFELVDKEWTVASGELTPTLKLKRNVLTAKYKDLIDKIYKGTTTMSNIPNS